MLPLGIGTSNYHGLDSLYFSFIPKTYSNQVNSTIFKLLIVQKEKCFNHRRRNGYRVHHCFGQRQEVLL